MPHNTFTSTRSLGNNIGFVAAAIAAGGGAIRDVINNSGHPVVVYGRPGMAGTHTINVPTEPNKKGQIARFIQNNLIAARS